MSDRTEAIQQFATALRMGRKYYNACVAKGENPYPLVLNELIDENSSGNTVKIGLVDIPMDRIVGTWTGGRKSAFAGNFMPLLDENTEFGNKWINLCEAHLGETGITDPITCLEYLGKFYVQEGNKRVSVLKSYNSPSIPGQVTRIVPPLSDDPEIQLYYEFMDFFKVSKTYQVTFTHKGSCAKLQAALGFEPDHVWTEDERRGFNSDMKKFGVVFDQLNTEKLSITAGDALLVYLEVHAFQDIKKMTEDELKASLASVWADIRLSAEGDPISVATEPEEKEKGLLSRILGSPKLHAAFIYDFDPEKSAWAAAHWQGQKYLEEKMGQSVKISSFLCADGKADETMETAVRQGANVIFATSPMLMDECRRLAAKHRNIAIFNCSLSMPYAGVRSYYSRIYECKFVAGAVAGAMADNNLVGYVANYPIFGTPAGINAFALGARMSNPRVRVKLVWSCTEGDPLEELMASGVTVISNRDAGDESTAHKALDYGLYERQPDGGLRPLAMPCWQWGAMYTQIVRAVLDGSWEESSKPINYWWGMASGVVDVKLSEELPAGVTKLAEILREEILDGSLDPFRARITDRSGRLRCDGETALTPEEIMHMDWLCDNVDGEIPGYDELLPRSQGLVRLLGIYRESLAPQKQEKQL